MIANKVYFDPTKHLQTSKHSLIRSHFLNPINLLNLLSLTLLIGFKRFTRFKKWQEDAALYVSYN